MKQPITSNAPAGVGQTNSTEEMEDQTYSKVELLMRTITQLRPICKVRGTIQSGRMEEIMQHIWSKWQSQKHACINLEYPVHGTTLNRGDEVWSNE